MGDGGWLDDDEQQVWRGFLEASALLMRQLSLELDASAHDLVMGEYELLVRLSEAPDWSVRMSELADDLVHSRSRLTHAIARMESRGLVERRACPGDRRGVLAVMTPTGFAHLERAAPLHVAGVREHLFDRLAPDQVRALGDIWATLLPHLREVSGCPAGLGISDQPLSPQSCPEREPEDVGDRCGAQADGELAEPANEEA